MIPETTPEKIAQGKAYKQARKDGDDIPGLNEWNIRWVGPEGYSGKAAKKIRQEFKAAQKEKATVLQQGDD